MGAATAALDHQTTSHGHHGPDPSCRWGRGSGNTVTERPGSPPGVLGPNCNTPSRDSTPKTDRRAQPPTPGITFYVGPVPTRDPPLEPRSMLGTESLGVLFRLRVMQLHQTQPRAMVRPRTYQSRHAPSRGQTIAALPHPIPGGRTRNCASQNPNVFANVVRHALPLLLVHVSVCP
jgi:hypothetical protein